MSVPLTRATRVSWDWFREELRKFSAEDYRRLAEKASVVVDVSGEPVTAELVSLDVSDAAKQEIIVALETLVVRAKNGEFETIYIIGFDKNGSSLTVERGKKLDRLRTVGLLESLKIDILGSTETDEPTGL